MLLLLHIKKIKRTKNEEKFHIQIAINTLVTSKFLLKCQDLLTATEIDNHKIKNLRRCLLTNMSFKLKSLVIDSLFTFTYFYIYILKE